MSALKRAYRTLYRSGLSLEEAMRALDDQGAGFPEVRSFAQFVRESKRGIIR